MAVVEYEKKVFGLDQIYPTFVLEWGNYDQCPKWIICNETLIFNLLYYKLKKMQINISLIYF